MSIQFHKPKGNPINSVSTLVWGIDSTPLLNHWRNIFIHNKMNRGKSSTIKYMKQLYVQAVQYSLYQTVTYIPFRKCGKDRVCKDLKPFKHLLRSRDPNKTRAALAVLRQFELYRLEASRDISSVTDPCPEQPQNLKQEFKEYLNKEYNLPFIKMGEPIDHLTSKKGPSKDGALLTCLNDLKALSFNSKLKEDIILLSEELGDNHFGERIERLNQRFDGPPSPALGRIQVFSAPGGKTRIIAIYDYWSQRALRPLHKAVFRNLRMIKSDSTFGHQSASDWLKDLSNAETIYSYDLTAATDRIPMWIHRYVLEAALVPEQRVLIPIIERILLREFSLSWEEESKVSYCCGQPMGAYGSWALLAYSHHCIARFCGADENQYRIIGDDIVILGEAGAKYRKFMDSVSVSISESKSIISPKLSTHITGEVAKRLIRDHVEITPPTPNLLHKSVKDWRVFPMLLEDLVSRDNTLEYTPLVALINRLFSDKWSTNVISVLTFPYGRGTKAREIIRGVLEPICPWKEYDNLELANLFVRYRIAMLYKTATKLCKDYDPYDCLAGGFPPEIFSTEVEESPLSSIRRSLASKLIETIESLRNKERKLSELYDEDEIESISLDFLDEELYSPDYLGLKFLETKYQRQYFFSNTVLDLHRRLESGSLMEYIEKYTPPIKTLVDSDLTAFEEEEDDFEVIDFDF